MATFLLTETEYSHLVTLKNELLELSKTASPRAASTYRTLATNISATLARETGARASKREKEASKATIDAIRIEKQKARLQKMQEKMSQGQQGGAQPTTEGTGQPATRDRNTKASS